MLREAPRSLAALSEEHRDGWGLAIFEERGHTGWTVYKGVLCARDDAEFHRLAVGTRGELMVAHIRQRTVGLTSLDNTHPFHRGRWLFAHNGTIRDLDFLHANTSRARLSEIRGDTDSELFFAFLLSRLDAAGLGDVPPTMETDAVIRDLAEEVRSRPNFGACNFLLSDGEVMYAHRFGRSLFLLERGPDDEVRSVRSSRDGTIVQTPWSPQRRAVFVASERLTDEPWQTLEEGTMLRVDRYPVPRWRLLAKLAAARTA